MKHRCHRLALLLAAMLSAAVCAQDASAPLPDKVALPELLRLVAQRSPRLAVERTSIDAAEAERMQASAYPNPTLSAGRFKPAGGARTVFDANSQSQLTLDLPVLIGSQRKARMEAADQAAEAARAHVGAAGHETAIKAIDAFVGLQAAQEKLGVLEKAASDVQHLSKIVSERMASGMASRYEATRAEIEVAAIRTRLADARVERTARMGELAALIGAPGWQPVAIGAFGSNGIALERPALAAALKETNAQLVAARRDEAAARAAAHRAERERIPVPVVSVGRTWTSDPFGAANYIGLSTEIPILDKRLGPVAKAQAELRAAQLRREAIEIELDAELARALEAIASRRSALAQFDRSIGSKLDALRQMAEDYYQLGRGSILELIDATRSRLESSLSGVEVRAQLVDEEMRLLALTGRLPE